MARTTAELVKNVLAPGKDYDTVNNPSLEPAITAAEEWVSDIASFATESGITVSAKRLQVLATWIAAHVYMTSDRGYTSKSTDGSSGSFQGQTGRYFEATYYGQTAVALDPTGYLASLAKGVVRPQLIHGGKTPAERINYWDR